MYLSENEDNSDDHHNHPTWIDHYPSADPCGPNLPYNEHSIRYDMILIFLDLISTRRGEGGGVHSCPYLHLILKICLFFN